MPRMLPANVRAPATIARTANVVALLASDGRNAPKASTPTAASPARTVSGRADVPSTARRARRLPGTYAAAAAPNSSAVVAGVAP